MTTTTPIDSLRAAYEAWERETLAATLRKAPERDAVFATSSGPVKRLYTPLDIADLDYERDLGFPGEFPFTRGIQPTMYRGRLWSMRQYAGYGTPEETNRRFRYLLAEGQTGLSVAFDLPTQLGYDSDDPLAAGEVGQVGVAVDSLRDMEILFEGIPLDKVSTSMTINAPAPVLVAMYIAVGEKQGIPPAKLMGTAQNDVLKEYVARGTYIFPPRPSLRLAADLIAYCAREVPKFNSISISGYHIREAGSTAVQEIASPSPTPSPTCRRRSNAARTSTRSAAVSPGSSTRITTSSKRWPSTALCGACGRTSCATALARPIRAR